MLIADEALEPTVSTRSNPGGVLRGGSMLRGGRSPASSACRLAKGFRIGILTEDRKGGNFGLDFVAGGLSLTKISPTTDEAEIKGELGARADKVSV